MKSRFRITLLILFLIYALLLIQQKQLKDQAVQVELKESQKYRRELFNDIQLGEKEYPLQEFKVKPKACKKVSELGSSANKWAICVSHIHKPCTILSFGVGFDYSFDIEANKRFACEIFLFDPTPSVVERMSTIDDIQMHFYPWGLAEKTSRVEIKNNWWNQREVATVQMYSFEDILENLKIPFAPIIKLDIEGYEFGVIESILDNRHGVRQILLELHYGGLTNDDFRQVNGERGGERWLEIFNLLDQRGFEIFWKLGGRYDTKSAVCKKDPSSKKCYHACLKDTNCKGALQEYGFIKTKTHTSQK